MIFEERKFFGVVEIGGKPQEAMIIGKMPMYPEGPDVPQLTRIHTPTFHTVGQLQIHGQMVQFPVVMSNARTIEDAFAQFPAAYADACQRAQQEVNQRLIMSGAGVPAPRGLVN